MYFELNDHLTNRIISRHNTAYAAGKAAAKHDRKHKRANGPKSYVPMSLTANGKRVGAIPQAEYYRGLFGKPQQ